MLNSIRPWKNIYRRKSKKIFLGSVPVGGDSPISVQSMTNTLTTDVNATLNQINSCVDAGADLMRVSCPDVESTKALKKIGYNIEYSNLNELKKIIKVFQMRFRPELVNGKLDLECFNIAKSLNNIK